MYTVGQKRTPWMCARLVTSWMAILWIVSLTTGCVSKWARKPLDPQKEQVSTEAQEGATADPIEPVEVRDFILGAGDTIGVEVFRHSELTVSGSIDPTLRMTFPLIGRVQVGDRGLVQLQEDLTQRYAKYIVEPQVIIRVTAIASQKVTIVGEVANPGVYPLNRKVSLSELIAQCGGFTADARESKVLLFRRSKGSSPEAQTLNVARIFEKGDLSQDIALQNGDILYVPRDTLSDVAMFMGNIQRILSPLLALESGIVLWPQMEDVLTGEEKLINSNPLAITPITQ